MYRSSIVALDEDAIRVGTKSYALEQIAAVRLREGLPHGAFWIVLLVFGLFHLLAVVAVRMSPSFGRSGITEAVIGLVLCGTAILRLRAIRPIYSLVLRTRRGDVLAAKTRDYGVIRELQHRIELRLASGREWEA